MNKQEFFARLKEGLAGLPNDEIEERIGFYGEMIDDSIEEGLTEEQAVGSLGPISDIVSQIVAQTPLTTLVKEKVKRNRRLKPWEIVLLILGAPVWLPLLIAAAAVLISVYAAIWAIVISLWAVDLALAVSAVAGVIGGIIMLCRGEFAQGAAAIGAGLVLAGLAILLFFGCTAVTRGVLQLTKKFALWIKSLFVGKENK